MQRDFPSTKRRLYALLGALLLLMSFGLQGVRDLWEPDETRYTVVAMNMLDSGDFAIPRVHPEQPHYTKPPLTYWSIAASLEWLGRNQFAARLPSALAFLFTVLLVHSLGRQFVPGRPWLPALIFGTMLVPGIAANFVSTDMLLTAWETLALAAFCRAVWGIEGQQRRFVYLMWLAFAMAFLTKGPPGLLPLLAILAWRYWRPVVSHPPPLLWLRGLLIVLLLGGSWYLYLGFTQPGLLRQLFMDEVIARTVTGQARRHAEWYGAFAIYLPVLLFGTLPWTWPMGQALLRAWRHRKSAPPAADGGRQRFLLLWLLLPLLIFFLTRSRLPLYILPLFVPLALLAARELEDRQFRFGAGRWLLLALWCAAALSFRYLPVPISEELHMRQPRDLAGQLHALCPRAVDEVAFVHTRAILGVEFYASELAEALRMEEVPEELAEHESRLWLVEPEDEDAFLQVLREQGVSLPYLGAVDIGRTYHVYRGRELENCDSGADGSSPTAREN
jgi:4-amino-4-deoxy-L-arabinose transferase